MYMHVYIVCKVLKFMYMFKWLYIQCMYVVYIYMQVFFVSLILYTRLHVSL